jgi:hypothetical protein
LDGVLRNLPDDRVQEVLDFARFLSIQEHQDGWRAFGRTQLARAYSDDEPEYSLDDIQQEAKS